MSKLVHSAHKEKKRVREATISATDNGSSSGSSSSNKKKKTKATDVEVGRVEDIDSLEKFESELNIKPKQVKAKGKGKVKGGKNEGKKKQPTNSSVIYLGHIAHGFYEKQMKEFFAQFGDVKRVKLFRSAKTGKSKGYAFIEFLTPEVAQTVSEAMHGYFLHERQLVCNVVPPEKLHEGMFIYHKSKIRKNADTIHSVDGQDDEENDLAPDFTRNEKQIARLKASQTKKMKELKAKGIDFDILECTQ